MANLQRATARHSPRNSHSAPDVGELTKIWRRYQSQKWKMSGGVEARMLVALSMYFGEHTVMQYRDTLQTRGVATEKDKNRLNLIFNTIRRLAKRRIGHLYRVAPEFYASPNTIDPRAFDKSDVVNDLIRALKYKQQEETLQWLRLWWAVLCGVVIEHTPWAEDVAEEPIPEFDEQTGELLWRDNRDGSTLPQSAVEQEIMGGAIPEWFTVKETPTTVGDVASQIVPPFNFFIDSGVTDIQKLAPDQWCFIVEVKTGGFIKENFGNDALKKLQSSANIDLGVMKTRLLDKGPALSNMNLRDLLPAIQGTRAPGDPPLFLVATAYQPASSKNPHGRRAIFVPDQGMLDDGEIPYSEIPCVDIHYGAPAHSFWTEDFVTDLIPAQKFFNKRMSQMGEAANASIHEVLLLGGELSETDIPSDLPGVVEDGLNEDGTPRVAPLQRTSLPAWFVDGTVAVQEWLEKTGGSDILQMGKFPGQLRGPLALPILQEIQDSEDGPFFAHLGERLSRIHQMRVNRVKEYYPPVRTLHYTGRNSKDEVLVFHTDDVLRAGTDFTIKVDRGSLQPQLSVIRRAQVMEDLNSPLAILYTSPRTGKLDATRIAAALRYTDKMVEERAVQYRKLAQNLISRLWQGQELPPEIPYPFWDHNAILDELEAAMATTEWLEASSPVKQMFIGLYEKCREYLASIQQSQMDSVQSQMMQGAVAQATQQAAAKAAAAATDAALAQVYEQAGMTGALRGPGGEMREGMVAPGAEQKTLPAPRPQLTGQVGAGRQLLKG